MNTLQTTIHSLSQQFANGLLEAIRGVPLEELMAETSTPGARTAARRVSTSVSAKEETNGETNGWKNLSSAKPARVKRGGRSKSRSAEAIHETADKIVTLLQAHPDGLNAEKIKDELSLERKHLPKPILLLLSAKRIKKTGQKRATMYFAKTG